MTGTEIMISNTLNHHLNHAAEEHHHVKKGLTKESSGSTQDPTIAASDADDESDNSGADYYRKLKQRARASRSRIKSDTTGGRRPSLVSRNHRHNQSFSAHNHGNSIRRKSLDAAVFGSDNIQQSLRNVMGMEYDDDNDNDKNNNKTARRRDPQRGSLLGSSAAPRRKSLDAGVFGDATIQQSLRNLDTEEEDPVASSPTSKSKKNLNKDSHHDKISPVAIRRRSLDCVLMEGSNHGDHSAFGRKSRRHIMLDDSDNSSITSNVDDINDLRNMCNTLDDALSKHSSSHWGDDGSWSSYDSDNPPPRNSIREVVIAALPEGTPLSGQRAVRRTSYNSMDQMLLGESSHGSGASYDLSGGRSQNNVRGDRSHGSSFSSRDGAPKLALRCTSDDEREEEDEKKIFPQDEEDKPLQDDSAGLEKNIHHLSIRTLPDQPPKKVTRQSTGGKRQE